MEDKPSILIKVVSTLLAYVAVAFLYGVIGMLVAWLTGVAWSWSLLWSIGLCIFVITYPLNLFAKKYIKR